MEGNRQRYNNHALHFHLCQVRTHTHTLSLFIQMTGNDRQYLLAWLVENDTDSHCQVHWHQDNSTTPTPTEISAS